jgi:hypothetical protein
VVLPLSTRLAVVVVVVDAMHACLSGYPLIHGDDDDDEMLVLGERASVGDMAFFQRSGYGFFYGFMI